MVPLAIVLSALVAAASALLAPMILRRLPQPEEEPGVDFAGLATRRFRVATFVVAWVGGGAMLLATEPTVWPIWAPLAGLGALLGMIDLKTGFLPLRLNYLAVGLVVAGALASCWLRGDWRPVVIGVVGAAGALGLYWLLWRFSRGQLGFGDVRLAGLLGLAAGTTSPLALMLVFFAGSAIGALWAVAVQLRGGKAFPYGPSMLLGAPVGLVITALLLAG